MRKKTNVSQNKRSGSASAGRNQGKQRTGRGSTGNSGHVSRGNDPSWYNLDPAITRDAASIAYSLPAGAPISTQREWSPDSGYASAVPGLLAVELMPTVGTAWNPDDPINMAAQQMYSFITHANSRNTSYDAADLMQYFLATAEAYSYVEFLKRIYGVARLFSYDNKYMPDTLLRAMHVDPETIRYNMADFRLGINMMINKLATFAVPNTMSIFARKQFLYSGLYTDSDSVKDQIYMFVPGAFYYWDWRNATLVSVKYRDMWNKFVSLGMKGEERASGYLYSARDLIEMGNYIINAIMHNTDMGTMNGDVLKAYGSNILSVAPIDESYTVIPSVNVGVLEQIQNSLVVTGINQESLNITSSYITTGSQEGTSVLESVPAYKGIDKTSTTKDTNWLLQMRCIGEAACMGGRHVLQTRVDNPDPPYNMELTRLMPGLLWMDISRPADPDEAASTDYRLILICGTEIVTNLYVYDDVTDEALPGHNVVVSMDEFYGDKDIDWLEKVLPGIWRQDRLLMAGKSFDYLPTLYRYDGSRLQDLFSAAGPISVLEEAPSASQVTINTTKYTTIEVEDLNNMHRVAIMNEFYVPKIALKG